MADFFKDSVTAGREARQRGQGIKNPDRPDLELGSEQMSSGYRANAGPTVAPRATATPTRSADDLEARLNAIDEAIDGPAPAQPEAAATPQQGNPDGNLAKDLGLGLVQGVVGLGGGVYELGNMVTRGALDRGTEAAFGRSGSSALKGATDYLRSKESQAMAQQRAELEQADGFVDSFLTVVTNPRLAGSMAMEMVPQLATVAGAARAVASRTLATAAAKNVAPEVAQKLAATNATRTVLGLNAGMEGASAGADVRQSIMAMSEAELSQSPQYQKLLQQYGDTEQGRADARMRLANDASLVATGIGSSISLLSGVVTGAGALESKVLTKGIVPGKEAGKRTALGVTKDIAMAGAKEIPQEALEEGGSTFGQNVGLMASGAKPDQDLFEGVPQAAGAGGALGLLAGAGFGAVNTGSKAIKERAQAKAEENKIEIDNQAPAGSTLPQMDDKVFFDGVRTPEGQRVLAGLYATGDENLRRNIEVMAERMGLGTDFFGQMDNPETIKYGQDLVAKNPGFIQQFTQKIESFANIPTNEQQRAAAEGVELNQTPYMPTNVRKDFAQAPQSDLAPLDPEEDAVEQAIASLPKDLQEAARDLVKKKSAPSGTLVPGPESQQSQRNIPLDVLRLGYERRVRNLANMPEDYRAQQAQQGIQEMINEGFSPEVAAEVFAPLGTQIEAAPAPAVTQEEQTNDVGTDEERRMVLGSLIRFDKEEGIDTASSDYTLEQVSPEMEQLAKAFGVSIVGFTPNTDKNPRAKFRRGFMTTNKKTGKQVIALNMGSKDQHLFVIGHEILHVLVRKDPAAGKQLVKLVKEFIAEDGQAAYRKKLVSDLGYKAEEVDEEMAADVLGMLFKDKNFWAYVNEKQPTLIEKILDIIGDLIKKFGNIAGNRELAIQKYVTDLEAVRQILSEFVVTGRAPKKTKKVKFKEIQNAPVPNQVQENQSSQSGVQEEGQTVEPVQAENQQPSPVSVSQQDQSGQTQDSQAQSDAKPAVNVDEKRLKILMGRADTLLENGKLDAAGYKSIVDMLKAGQIEEARTSIQKAGTNVRKVLKKAEVEQIKSDNKIDDKDMVYTGPKQEIAPQQKPQTGTFNNNTQSELPLGKVPSLAEQRQEQRKKDFRNEKYSDTKAATYIRVKGKLDTGAFATHNVFDKDGKLIGRIFRSPRFGLSFPFVDRAGLEQSTRDWGRDADDEPTAAGYKHNSMMAQLEKAGFTVEPIVPASPQGELNVKQDLTEQQTKVINGYRAKVNKVMTLVGDESQQARALAEFRAFQEKIKKAMEGKQKPENPFADDKGGVFSNFAKTGAYGAEGFAQATAKDAQSAAQKAAADQEADLIAGVMNARVSGFMANLQQLLGQMDQFRDEMEQAGIPEGSINRVLSQSEAQLRALLDENNPLAKTLANPVGSAEAEQNDAQEGQIGDNVDQLGPDNMSLFTPEGVAIADKLIQDVLDKKLTPLEAVRVFFDERATNKDIGYMDLVQAYRARGIEPEPVLYSLGTQPAVQVTLRTYIEENEREMGSYVARQRWLESLDRVMSETAATPATNTMVKTMLTTEEKAIYADWKKARKKLEDRIAEHVTEQGGEEVLFGTVEEAFPDALPVQFRLNEMNQLDQVTQENMRAIMGQDLERAWVDDAINIMTARPDLTEDLMSKMTEEEQKRVMDRRDMYLREEMRKAKMVADSPAYNQLFQLQHIDPNIKGVDKIFAQFSYALQYSNQMQKQQVLLAALHINAAVGRAKKDNKNMDVFLNSVMQDIYGVDTLFGMNPDEIARVLSRVEVNAEEDAKFVRNQEATIVSEEDVQTDEQGSNEQNPEWLMQRAQGLRRKKGAHSGNVVHAEIEGHLAKVVANWPGAPRFEVLMNAGQIADEQLKAAVLARGDAKAVFDPKTGTTYIFSESMQSVADAEFTFLHEVYGHFGMRAFLGTKLDAFLQNTYKTNQQVRAAADALIEESRNDGYEMSQLEATEEVLADMAAQGDTSSGFKNILGKLIQFLRSIGMNIAANWMSSTSDAEVSYVLKRSREAARTMGPGAINGAPSDVRFAMNKLPVELYAKDKSGKLVGYAVLNPITNTWNVYAGKDFKSGDYGSFNVEKYEHALAILGKVGSVTKLKDYVGKQRDRQPGDYIEVPSFNDVEGWKKFQRYAQINLQNQYLPIFEVAQYLKENGRENEVTEAILLYEGKLAPILENMRKKYVEPISKLLDEIGKQGGSLAEVDDYLAARHAKERNRAIRNEINPDNKAGSGITDKESDTILAELQGRAYGKQLEAIGRLTDKLSKQKIAYMVQHGLISEESAAAADQYKHYVNLSGNPPIVDADGKTIKMDQYDKESLGGRAFNLRGRDMKRATGRMTKAVDVLANTLNAYTATMIRGQKNVVAQAVLEMIENNPDPNFADVQKLPERRAVNTAALVADANILKALGDKQGSKDSGRRYLRDLKKRVDEEKITVDQAKEELVARIKEAGDMNLLTGDQVKSALNKVNTEVIKSGRLSPDGYVSMQEDNTYLQNDNVMVVKRKGQIITIEFKNGDANQFGTFANAIHGMRGQASPDTLNAFGKFNRFLSQLITSWNPAWVMVNGLRDVQTAFANMAADPKVGTKIAMDMKRNWRKTLVASFRSEVQDQMDTAKGVRSWILGKVDTKKIDPEFLQYIKDFKEDGGSTFFLDRGGLEDQLKALEDAMKGADNMQAKLESVGKLMESISMPMELATRVAAYKALIENGWSRQDAALYAKDLTVNFNLKGASSLMRNLFIFFNPAVQGTVRLFKDYSREKDGAGRFLPSNQFLKVAGSFAMMGMMVNMLAAALTGDDDDEYPDKQNQIPAYKRATSMVLLPDVPGFAIPLPYGWNAFYAFGHFMMDSVFGNTPIEVTSARIANAAMDAMLPVRIEGNVFKALVPTPISPVVDLLMNENKWGAPIYKEKDAYTDYERPNSYMHFDSVSPISRAAARFLNKMTGGEEYGTGGIVDVNPAWIDYLIGSYMPGLFNELYKGASLATRVARGEDVARTPIPLIDRFSAYVPEGYAAGAFRRANTFVATKYTQAMALDGEERNKIFEQYPGLDRAYAVAASAEQSLKQVRQDMKFLNENKYITDSYKVEERNRIKKLEKEIYESAVRDMVALGFEDKVLGEDDKDSTLNKVARLIRKGSL